MGRAETEVAILGAGPAGIAAACGLVSAGVEVTLIDAGTPLTPRVESLPPSGLALAESLGLADAIATATLGQAREMRMHWRVSPERRVFGVEAPLLLDRVLLHRALGSAVTGLRRITARARILGAEGGRPRVGVGDCILTARIILDARGRAAQRSRAGLVALAFEGRQADRALPAMEIEALAAGWLWASTLPDGRVSGQLFLPAATLAGLDRQARHGLLHRHLAAIFPDMVLRPGAVAPAMLTAVDDPVAGPGLLRLGDAALARDPIASHGLIHALRSGGQAAVAVATLLDPACDPQAALAFLRDRHRRAFVAAQAATARAYADQSRLRSPFWEGEAPPLPTQPQLWPSLSHPLTLAAPLRQVPVLELDRIRWAHGLWLETSGEAVPRLGPISAPALAQLLTPPAPLTELSARLERAVGQAVAQAILRRLLDEGALASLTQPEVARSA
jgi:2-polyprenyl-6-methoxyphenol hydroxylase-like FAD-dependent oxidoreductase